MPDYTLPAQPPPADPPELARYLTALGPRPILTGDPYNYPLIFTNKAAAEHIRDRLTQRNTTKNTPPNATTQPRG